MMDIRLNDKTSSERINNGPGVYICKSSISNGLKGI